MKQVDLIRTIARFGCILVRHGGRHDWYRNPSTGVSQPVPRHREINDHLARQIIRMLRNPADGADPGDEDTAWRVDPADPAVGGPPIVDVIRRVVEVSP